jgi:threonine aldolase
MIFLSLDMNVPLNALQVIERLNRFGVKVDDVSSRGFRLVTHYWIDDEGVKQTIDAFARSIS